MGVGVCTAVPECAHVARADKSESRQKRDGVENVELVVGIIGSTASQTLRDEANVFAA